MKFRINFDKTPQTSMETQATGQPWNRETVRGWKLSCVDLLQPIKEREKREP